MSLTLHQCLNFYVAEPLSISREDPIKVIAQETGVNSLTVKRWLKGGPIQGQSRFSLIAFLWAVRIDCIEFSHLEPIVQKFLLHVGLGVLPLEKAMERLKLNRSSVYRYCHGESKPSPDKVEVMEELTKLGEARLNDKVASLVNVRMKPEREEFLAKTKNSSLSIDRTLTNNESPKLTNGTLSKDDLIKSAASMSEAILPLLLFIDSDNFSDEERREFRRQVSGDGIFRLSNCLSRLCSRTARKMCSQHTKGGE